jgi:hypothetical protein
MNNKLNVLHCSCCEWLLACTHASDRSENVKGNSRAGCDKDLNVDSNVKSLTERPSQRRGRKSPTMQIDSAEPETTRNKCLQDDDILIRLSFVRFIIFLIQRLTLSESGVKVMLLKIRNGWSELLDTVVAASSTHLHHSIPAVRGMELPTWRVSPHDSERFVCKPLRELSCSDKPRSIMRFVS